MRRRVGLVAILLCGCAGVLGLDEIAYTPPDAGTASVDGGGDEGARSDARSEGDAGGVDAQVDGGCSGRNGHTMVRITPSMCIDSTEVTHDEYNEFLLTGPVAPPTGECSWVNYRPKNFPGGSSSKPVVDVNWCQARGYCLWAGKDLCGALDGGMLVRGPIAVEDTAGAAWMRACTAAGSVAYAYANGYEAGVCNAYDKDGGGQLEEVANRPGCVGGLPGLFDMNGNVHEWILACDILDAGADVRRCAYAGQSFTSDIADRSCVDSWAHGKMTEDYTDTGFRCCAP